MSRRRNLGRYTRKVVNWCLGSWASAQRKKWTTLPPLGRHTWSGKSLDEMTLEEAIEWAFTSPITDEDYARADTLLAEMNAAFQQKNYELVYHILASFYAQPEPVYRGGTI